jgi:hypothetical protein
MPVWKMAEDYLYLFGLNVTFILIGCAVFLRRDLKS